MMLYELDEIERNVLLGNDRPPVRQACVCHKFIRLHDGSCPVHGFVRKAAAPGERIQTWWCEDCQDWHTGSVLGGPIGDPHGER